MKRPSLPVRRPPFPPCSGSLSTGRTNHAADGDIDSGGPGVLLRDLDFTNTVQQHHFFFYENGRDNHPWKYTLVRRPLRDPPSKINRDTKETRSSLTKGLHVAHARDRDLRLGLPYVRRAHRPGQSRGKSRRHRAPQHGHLGRDRVGRPADPDLVGRCLAARGM